MAVVIDAVDLVALAALWVLIGLTLAAAYTFQKFADTINVSILGQHPFAGVARGIENTIVHWCNVGAKSLEGVANLLWRGLTWSISVTLQAIMAIPRDIHNALAYVKDHLIVNVVRASLSTIHTAVNALEARVGTVTRELSSEVVRLDAKIERTATATVGTIERELGSEITRVEGEITSDIQSLRHTLRSEIDAAAKGAESIGAAALSKLSAAENAALDALDKAEGATAAELRDFIKQVPLTDIGAALAALPLVIAAVNILEAETGLGRAECRAKVKGICGTDPSQWAKLLEGLALVGIGFNIKELIEAIVGVAETVAPELEGFIG